MVRHRDDLVIAVVVQVSVVYQVLMASFLLEPGRQQEQDPREHQAA
jgi:hypothetical protein